MKEYAFDATVNFKKADKNVNAKEWYPSLDTCLVAVRQLIERSPTAIGFHFSIVQRDHTS
jgi:hypothetical protein